MYGVGVNDIAECDAVVGCVHLDNSTSILVLLFYNSTSISYCEYKHSQVTTGSH